MPRSSRRLASPARAGAVAALALTLAAPASQRLAAQQRPADAAGDTAALRPSSLLPAGGLADTVTLLVVRIRAARQADYERWLRAVVVPAAERSARRFPSHRAYWAMQQLLVPAERTDDSTVTYVYLDDYSRLMARVGRYEPDRSRRGGWRGLFEDAGMAPAEIEGALATYGAMHRGSEAHVLVRTRLPIPQ